MIHENDCVNTCAEEEKKESFYEIQCKTMDFLNDAKRNLDRIREVVEGFEPQLKGVVSNGAKEQAPSRRFDRNEYSNMQAILYEALLTADYAQSLAYRLERYFPREEKESAVRSL